MRIRENYKFEDYAELHEASYYHLIDLFVKLQSWFICFNVIQLSQDEEKLCHSEYNKFSFILIILKKELNYPVFDVVTTLIGLICWNYK